MRLLEPLNVGARTLPCRVVFGPIVTNLADGRTFSARHTAFYRERAAGGCGLVVTENASVHETDQPYERSPDASLAGPGWVDIAKACAEFGTVVVAGLNHAGGQSTSAFSQRELWAPSDEPDVNTREVPKIMEQADIDEVVAGFAAAAASAAESGLAGVEINAGQHSLIRQYLSGLTNRRGDAYGEDRGLLAQQVLQAARESIGDGIIGLRLSCDELAPWAGITPEAAAELAARFAPLVDYITVVRGAIFSVAETRPTAHHGSGFNLDLAAAVREAVGGSVPIIAQGSIVSAEQAEEAVAAGGCDAVEMTRAQLADPQLVARTARRAPVRPCVLCNQLCNVQDNRNPIISCIANPRCGHETIDPPEPASPPEPAQTGEAPSSDAPAEVLVVGAGPAGLEAARIAARRGLSVEVREQGERPGGMAAVAAVAPAHAKLAELVAWLEHDALSHGARIHYGQPVTAAELADFDGQTVIATGSSPGTPGFGSHPEADIIDGVAVLRAAASGELGALLADRSVVVWDPTGGAAAIAVTEMLAWAAAEGSGDGPGVRFVTPDANAATMLSLTGDLAGANVRLQQAGVEIIKRQRLVEVTADSVETVHTFTGEPMTIPAGLVVDMSARLPDESLWSAMTQGAEPGAAPDQTGNVTGGRALVRIGDAVAPRTVAEAIREGRAAAMDLAAPTGKHHGGDR